MTQSISTMPTGHRSAPRTRRQPVGDPAALLDPTESLTSKDAG